MNESGEPKSFSDKRGDLLLNLVVTTGDDADALELLEEFFAGYPIERLTLLLNSENESAVKAGAWIASELGDQVAPIVDELVHALKHSSKYVRFHVLDSLLLGASSDRGDVLAEAVACLSDDDEAVRWKAMDVLARAETDQLAATLPFLSNPELASLMAWLVNTKSSDVSDRLASASVLEKRVAVVAAARDAYRGDGSALQSAARSENDEVARFAGDVLDELAGFEEGVDSAKSR